MVALSVAAYILIRSASFLTYQFPLVNQIIAGILIFGFAYCCFKNIKWGFLLMAGELIIDGAGHFFELQGLLLRTWFLAIFTLSWVFFKIKDKKIFLPSRQIIISSCFLGLCLIYAVINGLLHDHSLKNIFQDLVVYFFLALIIPALEWKEEIKKIFPSIIKTWIVGSALFSAITLFIYSSGLGYLPDNYYHWFRNVASGKITDLGNHFFRIVLPEHLLIVPIIIILTSLLIKDPKNKMLWALQFCSAFILALNFSRIYFLALVIGLLILAIKQNFKQWLTVSAITGLTVLLIFSVTNFVTSQGQSSGLGLLGLRLGGSVAPTADVSGAIRLAILPDAVHQIRARPLLGSGLGATITYIDPATKLNVTRTQFDWGYLELLVELGIVGTFFFLILIAILFKQTFQSYLATKSSLPLGLFAGGITLLIINITTPALFHGFGILYFVAMIAMTNDVSAQSSDEPVHTS